MYNNIVLVGDIPQNSTINILKGKGTYEQNAVVFANAAKALQNTGKFENYEASLAAAKESLENGKALECLNKLIIK